MARTCCAAEKLHATGRWRPPPLRASARRGATDSVIGAIVRVLRWSWVILDGLGRRYAPDQAWTARQPVRPAGWNTQQAVARYLALAHCTAHTTEVHVAARHKVHFSRGKHGTIMPCANAAVHSHPHSGTYDLTLRRRSDTHSPGRTRSRWQHTHGQNPWPMFDRYSTTRHNRQR